jgi:hypothetical protein
MSECLIEERHRLTKKPVTLENVTGLCLFTLGQ